MNQQKGKAKLLVARLTTLCEGVVVFGTPDGEGRSMNTVVVDDKTASMRSGGRAGRDYIGDREGEGEGESVGVWMG